MQSGVPVAVPADVGDGERAAAPAHDRGAGRDRARGGSGGGTGVGAEREGHDRGEDDAPGDARAGEQPAWGHVRAPWCCRPPFNEASRRESRPNGDIETFLGDDCRIGEILFVVWSPHPTKGTPDAHPDHHPLRVPRRRRGGARRGARLQARRLDVRRRRGPGRVREQGQRAGGGHRDADRAAAPTTRSRRSGRPWTTSPATTRCPSTSCPARSPTRSGTTPRCSRRCDDVAELKAREGGPIFVHGSLLLTQGLLAAGLVDEMRLMVFPVILGSGRTAVPDRRRGQGRSSRWSRAPPSPTASSSRCSAPPSDQFTHTPLRRTFAPMTESYAAGETTPALLEETIGANFERTVAAYGGNEALVEFASGRRWTYDELDRDVNALARGLIGAGIAEGRPGRGLGAELRRVDDRPVRRREGRRDPGQRQPVVPHPRVLLRGQPVRAEDADLARSSSRPANYREMVEETIDATGEPGPRARRLHRHRRLGRAARRRRGAARTTRSPSGWRRWSRATRSTSSTRRGTTGYPKGATLSPPQHPEQRLLHDRDDQPHRPGPALHPGALLPLLRDGDGQPRLHHATAPRW